MIDAGAVRLVAEREVREQARGRVLWISTLISMVAVAALVVLPHVFSNGTPTYRIAVTGSPGDVVQAAIEDAVASAGAKPVLVPAADRAAAAQLLQGKGKQHVDLAVVLDKTGTAVLIDQALPADSTTRKALVAQAIARAVASAQAIAASGLSPAAAQALIAPKPLPIEHLRPLPGDNTDKGVAVAGAVLFYLLVLRYGIGLLMGVVQEKSTRVIEVVLSTVRPIDLLAGKVVGYSVLVFAQALLLVATALVSASAVGSTVLHAGAVRTIVETTVWVIIGFLLYAVLFAAAGALAAKAEDAQSTGAPLQIVLLAGYFVSFTGLSGSPTVLVRVLAYVPFTAPMDMPVLAASGGASTWQIVLSMLITVVAIVVCTRLAAAIFARSVLRTGQRVKLRQLLRERRSAGA
jgi:ABC-2 type transport system permease protein